MTPEQRLLLDSLREEDEIHKGAETWGSIVDDKSPDERLHHLCNLLNSMEIMSRRLGVDFDLAVRMVKERRAVIIALRKMAEDGFDDSPETGKE